MLKVGEWYRILGSGFDEYLFQYKKDSEFTAMFGKWLDGVYRGESYHPKDWHGIKPLTTLTPSEALHLLAEGFVLGKEYKNDNDENILEQIKLIDNKIHYVDGNSIHGSRRWYSLDNFTIHKLPDEE